MRKSIILLALFIFQASGQSLLLSGTVEDTQAQFFSAPESNVWQIQIKWMMKEGQLANKGDTVVIFDTANMEMEVEQKKNSLRQAEQQAIQKLGELKKQFVESDFGVKRAEIQLQIAQVDAKVPKSFRSDFDYAQIQFELIKAKDELKRATEKRTISLNAFEAEKKKQSLIVDAIQAEIKNSELQLASMALKSDLTGPIFYATHPWNGSKIQEGSTVQTTMTVASIASGGEMVIKAWSNEVDHPKLSLESQAMVYFESNLAKSYQAKIQSISTQSESRQLWGHSSWYPIEIVLLEQVPDLSPGMSALVEVSLGSSDK